MGSVFSFVSSDLKQKIDILNELINKDDQNYRTIKSMIEYEKENKLMEKSDFVNGARTLLRLHRGLGTISCCVLAANCLEIYIYIYWHYDFPDFIKEFLRQLGDLLDTDKTSSCCQDAYNNTLAKHHSWVIRKAAIVAMYTMPTREALFKKVNGLMENVCRVVELLLSLVSDPQVCGENVQRNIDVLPKMLEVTADVFNRTHAIYEIYQLHALP